MGGQSINERTKWKDTIRYPSISPHRPPPRHSTMFVYCSLFFPSSPTPSITPPSLHTFMRHATPFPAITSYANSLPSRPCIAHLPPVSFPHFSLCLVPFVAVHCFVPVENDIQHPSTPIHPFIHRLLAIVAIFRVVVVCFRPLLHQCTLTNPRCRYFFYLRPFFPFHRRPLFTFLLQPFFG